MPTGLVYDDIYLEHRTEPHPEQPMRLTATMDHLQAVGLLDRVVRIPPRPAEREDLLMAHLEAMIERVFQTCERGGGAMDMDTPVSARSCEAALMAVGGHFEAADRIMKGEVGNALCLTRPPGHHATPTRSMGFCLFNNVSLCAKYLQRDHGIEKVLIVDWDVHHGNGTQDIFESDPTVMYFSMHRSPFYPGTGSERERGVGAGEGFTLNIPLYGGITGEEYCHLFQEVVEGKAADFEPEFILISSGFDAYRLDPLGAFCLDAPEYAELTRILMGLADRTAKGRILSTLEGGYNVQDIPKLIEAHLSVLMGEGQ
ncbi:MAG: histone deacetylase family protein [Planctomycetota bacterium]|jgi:acetoin utilization deacetylase AcuC-like enzyme